MTPVNYADCQTVAQFYRSRKAGTGQNIVNCWEAAAFAASEAQPMTIRRALAFNAVLENSFLVHCPGDLLAGSGNLGKAAAPEHIPEAELQAARELTGSIGRRNFSSFADHHAPDYQALLRDGISGLENRIEQSCRQQNEDGRIFLESVRMAVAGASRYCRRWAEHLPTLAAEYPDYEELLTVQAEMLHRLATAAPATFHEALQLVLLFHQMCQLDSRAAMAFGRMDQYLYPFYLEDKRQGRVDDEFIQELLNHFFAKITQDSDVQNIALAGVKPEDGTDAVNELSYMILEACKTIGRPGGNCSARIDFAQTPNRFVKKCAEVIRTGIGYPAVMNDQLTIQALCECGYPLEAARDHCFVGCIEVFLQGRQAPWSDGRHNSLRQLPPALAWLAEHETQIPEADRFEQFYRKFLELTTEMTAEMLTRNTAAQAQYQNRAADFTSPFLSALTQDCIGRGRDVNDGGAVYPANKGMAIMGIASIADCLAAVKKIVCEEKRFTASQVHAMLEADFAGFETERRLLLAAAPKFGNAIEYVDSLAVRFVTDLGEVFKQYRNAQGGYYWMCLASNVSNIPGGKEVGATPDGRRAGEPLSDASSPYFGRDLKGPTSTIRSISRLPYRLCPGGSVVNLKIDPRTIAGEEGLAALASLITTCFRLGGSELQFNTTDRETLVAAMADPEHYGNLVVRVSGFSQVFTWLNKEVQQDILARTEHSLCR